MQTCRACGDRTSAFGSQIVLGHHLAEYRRCVGCGSVMVVDPRWLSEAYENPINSTDVGLVQRCRSVSVRLSGFLRASRRPVGSCLDFGGGNGLFVRMMRDAGFHFRWHDPMATNEFAIGHVGELSGRYSLITLIEVLEHLSDPADVLDDLAGHADLIVASTVLLPQPPPTPGRWWYYAPETGQHITFFTTEAMNILATRLGMRYWGDATMHLFSRHPVPVAARMVLFHERLARLSDAAFPRSGLTDADHAAVLASGTAGSAGTGRCGSDGLRPGAEKS